MIMLLVKIAFLPYYNIQYHEFILLNTLRFLSTDNDFNIAEKSMFIR
jgi:hypothetical protein